MPRGASGAHAIPGRCLRPQALLPSSAFASISLALMTRVRSSLSVSRSASESGAMTRSSAANMAGTVRKSTSRPSGVRRSEVDRGLLASGARSTSPRLSIFLARRRARARSIPSQRASTPRSPQLHRPHRHKQEIHTRFEEEVRATTPHSAGAPAWERAAGQGNSRPRPGVASAHTRAQCEAAPRRPGSCGEPTYQRPINRRSHARSQTPCTGPEPATNASRERREKILRPYLEQSDIRGRGPL